MSVCGVLMLGLLLMQGGDAQPSGVDVLTDDVTREVTGEMGVV